MNPENLPAPYQPGLSDADIVALARGGDRLAAGELVRRCGACVWAVIRALVPDLNAASDIYQNTWMRIFVMLERFDPARGSFCAWAKRFAQNEVANYFRPRGARLATNTESDATSPLEQLESREGAPETAVEQAEACQQLSDERRRLSDAVQCLPEELRTIVLLRHAEPPWTWEQIAQHLGIPLGTAVSRYKRALEQIRKRLESPNAG